ncbi:hypothetical protein K2173_010173 (mitochondrion) [Erythroxylum novogranatense]|uniref:Ribosomal protein S3 n=1 Tax=Erythroxylum novogranatense TaxID=1862640 RepID=A0AAV8S3Y9_9ROSI|nr:hypothetical protein K2173_010173 [Erythroxylum novogranatense]
MRYFVKENLWGSKQTRNPPWSHKPNQTKNYPPNRSQKLGRALIGLFVWKKDQNREKRDRLTTPHIQSPLTRDNPSQPVFFDPCPIQQLDPLLSNLLIQPNKALQKKVRYQPGFRAEQGFIHSKELPFDRNVDRGRGTIVSFELLSGYSPARLMRISLSTTRERVRIPIAGALQA